MATATSTREKVAWSVRAAGELANFSSLEELVVQIEHLLSTAYKALLAVEQLRPGLEALGSRQAFAFDENQARLERLSELLTRIGSGCADVEVHEAWQTAQALASQLDDVTASLIECLVLGDAGEERSQEIRERIAAYSHG